MQSMELWRKNLYILWGTQFIAMVGMNLVIPFLPFFVRQLGVTDETDLARWSGLVFAGPFFLSFIATPFWGSLGDKYGRKPMVVRALIGLAVSQLLIGLSQNVYQLFAFRIVQGGISGYIASSIALVSTTTPKERIGYALGFLQSSSAAGSVLGPFLGGLLADMIGYREIFFITASLCAVGTVFVIRMVHEPEQAVSAVQTFSVKENFHLMFSNRHLRLTAITLVVAQTSVLMIEPIFALFVESFRSDARFLGTLTGGIFSISGLTMVLFAAWWGKRNDQRGYTRNLTLALAVTGVVYAGHMIVQDLLQLAILRAFLGFAQAGVLPALYSLTNINSPPERRGGIIAVASSMTVLGNMIGPIIGGFVAGHFGITASFVANSCMLVGMSLIIRKSLTDVPVAHSPEPASSPVPVLTPALEGEQDLF
jgi:DHA1 family multidrug resistance protein-like MFS transporter